MNRTGAGSARRLSPGRWLTEGSTLREATMDEETARISRHV